MKQETEYRDSVLDPKIETAIREAVEREPFARELGMRLVELAAGHSVVEMVYDPGKMDNIYSRAHGGAIFALMDEAFETAAQTDGTIAVALNVNVTYAASPKSGDRLRSEARLINRTRKTANYHIEVRDQDGELVAFSNALAFRTGKPIPFLQRQ